MKRALKCLCALLSTAGAARSPDGAKLLSKPAHLQLRVGNGAGSGKSRSGIAPELEPVSDKRFFHADYPDDRRSPVLHKFGFPYPIVQDSGEYDKDYVKDENGDNGYWKVQLEYDTLKNKLAKEKDELAAAIKKELQTKNDLEAARMKEKEAERKAKLAESDEHKTSGDLAAVRNREHLDAGAAADKVEAEITDLEECKKQLEAAKKKLRELLAEKDAARKHKNETAQAEIIAQDKAVDADKAEEDAEANVTAEEKKYAPVLKSYEEELDDVKRVQQDLDKAAQDVHNSRHADPDGGVYEVVPTKGGAQSSACITGVVVLLAGLMQFV